MHVDGALSDILGTIMLLGVTVTVTVAAAGVYAARIDQSLGRAPAPHLEVSVSASVGATALELRHVGGDPVDMGVVRVIVEVSGVLASDGALGPGGTVWRIGDVATVAPLTAPLAPGARVEVSVVFVPTAGVIATSTLVMPASSSPPSPPGGFSITLRYDNGGVVASVLLTTSTRLTATVTHPEGRKAIREVTLDVSALNLPNAVSLRDDGLEGDLVAGDGNFTAFVPVPINVATVMKTLKATAVDHAGASVTSSVSIWPTDPAKAPRYNTTFIHKAALRVLKYESAGGSRKDKVTLDFKIKVPPLNRVTLPDGTVWELKRTYFAYDAFKGNDPASYELKDEAMIPTHGYKCYDIGMNPLTATNNMIFRLTNQSLTDYILQRDTLRFTLTTEWYQIGAPLAPPRVEYVTSWNFDPSLITTRMDTATLLRDSGWPSSFSSCTVD